jgi:hypothetical protein
MKAIPTLSTLPLGTIGAIDTVYTPSICGDTKDDQYKDHESNIHHALLWAFKRLFQLAAAVVSPTACHSSIA